MIIFVKKMSLANQKHFLQLGSKRSSSSGNSLCGNISTSPRLRQVFWYWTGRSYPGAQARSFCHPQPVWEGEIFLLGFKEDSLDLKLGCAVEDEIGRPDPNEPDGDGRCQSQRTAVSNQVKKIFPSVRGLVQLQDMDGLGAHHLSLFNITTIKKLVKV